MPLAGAVSVRESPTTTVRGAVCKVKMGEGEGGVVSDDGLPSTTNFAFLLVTLLPAPSVTITE
jgi:hypothetical protein